MAFTHIGLTQLGVYLGPFLVAIACLLPDSTWRTKDVSFLRLCSFEQKEQNDDENPLADEEMQSTQSSKPIIFSEDDINEMEKLEDPSKFAKKSRGAMFKTPVTRISSEFDTTSSSSNSPKRARKNVFSKKPVEAAKDSTSQQSGTSSGSSTSSK